MKTLSTRTESFYDRFSFFYPLVDLVLKPQKNILFTEIESLPQGKLLEIGVGNGSHLKRYGRHQVIAIDTSSAMLERASRDKLSNVALIRMSGEALTFHNDFFDYVVLSHVLAVVDQPNKVLDEVHRVLKPGGKLFILNHFTPNNLLGAFDRYFDPIARLFRFKSFFTIDHVKHVNKFSLVKDLDVGPFRYFKVLTYIKT